MPIGTEHQNMVAAKIPIVVPTSSLDLRKNMVAMASQRKRKNKPITELLKPQIMETAKGIPRILGKM